MRTTDLSELAAFDAVARHKSFRRAGEERGVTASAISHAVTNSWCAPEDWLYLYYPTRKYLSAGLRAIIETMRA
jgi:DNA-binding transcriptional LysR family regulator